MQHRGALHGRLVGECVQQASFANPRIPADQRDAGHSVADRFKLAPELIELTLPADKPRCASPVVH